MKHIFVGLLLFFLPLIISAKNLIIEGTVHSYNDQKSLAYVNIAISGSYYGTVSGLNGNFRLVIPEKLIDLSLSFSAIGYEHFAIPIRNIQGKINVSLKSIDYELGEIIVIPDDTLRAFLNKAYRKIPENYPDYPTRSLGFYRETIKEKGGDYLYLAEAIIDVYKTSYNNKSTGQVKINKSRKNIFPGSDSINPIQFYGGLFTPHTADIVKNRMSILKPSKDYTYLLKNEEFYNGRKVYRIKFQPKDNSKDGIQGEFYVDTESFAYLKFDYYFNDEKLINRGKSNPLIKISSIQNRKIRSYESIDGKYYLKSAFSNEILLNNTTNKTLELISEYILTKLLKDSTEQIPYNDQLAYFSIISEEAEVYALSDWKDYNILENDFLENTIISQYKADSLLNITYNKKSNSLSGIILKIVKKIEFDFNLVYQPVLSENSSYDLSISVKDANSINYNFSLKDKRYFMNHEVALKYKLSKQWKLFYQEGANLLQNEVNTSYLLGIEKSFPIKTYGNQILLSAKFGHLTSNYKTAIGIASNSGKFKLDKKEFDSNLIAGYYGVSNHGVSLSADLKFQITPLLFLNFFGRRNLNYNEVEKIMLIEKSGFYFFRKTFEMDINDERVSFISTSDNNLTAPLKLSNFFFGIGLTFSY